ncbi:MAG TPA: AAA family ATPase, partial [Solirubrobacterales bacterium]|nr:AAA family ATPase [Solirubrobacterales bacterium]
GLAARVGVAAGEPIADGEDLHGMAVVIASRLSGAAASGEVLVHDVVAALVASRDGVDWDGAAEYDLKGIPLPVGASRLRWRELASPADRPAAAGEAAERAAAAPEAVPPVDLRLPPVLAAFSGEPLIGRDREIALLSEATEPHPGRRAVVVLGEPGIGKTRHAAAAAAEAHASGTVVVLARCPQEPAVAFEPWVRAIGELALAGDEEWRARLAEAAGAELAALVPELDHRVDGAERASAADAVVAEGARYRLLRGIGAALSCAAGEAPLQVLLDDAHWCDPASAQVLGHLLESPPAARFVVVATARDRELGRRHPVSRALSDLRRTGDLAELRLEGLDPQGMAELVGARLGRAVTPRLAERLRSRTGGNPFFAGELVCDLEELGALGEAAALDGAPVPGAVAELVEERLARLDPGTERLLSAAAAIGPSVRVSLAASAAGMETAEAERAVTEAISERLVDDVPAAEPTIGFPHALVREALAAGASGAAQARLHLAIAEALKGDPEAEPAELARHLGLAVELTGTDPAVAAHRAAAAAATTAHDHEQAASHWRAVLELISEDDLASRGATLLELGEQELLSGDLFAARAAFAAAAAAGRTGGDALVLARAALGYAGGDVGFGWEVGVDDSKTLDLLHEAISLLGSADPRMTLRMTFRLSYLSVFSDDYEAVEALAEQAERLQMQLDDPEAHLLGRFTVLVARFVRAEEPDPLLIFRHFDELAELLPLAE